MSKSTEELIQEYSAAKAAFSNASTILRQRAVEESGFKVGDIVREVKPFPSNRPQPDRIISTLHGKVQDWDNNDITLSVKAYTRKRLKSGGWHATENEKYQLNIKPLYAGDTYWEIIGHEDLENTSK